LKRRATCDRESCPRKWHFKCDHDPAHHRTMETRPTVLLVENDPIEEMLARRAIEKSEIDCDVRVARDGCEACHILFDSGDPAPALILLELNIPKLNGFEVLSRIRGREDTKRLPVIIFSSSGEQLEVDKSFDLHANSYVQKHLDPEIYETRLKLLLYYWMAVNQNAIA